MTRDRVGVDLSDVAEYEEEDGTAKLGPTRSAQGLLSLACTSFVVGSTLPVDGSTSSTNPSLKRGIAKTHAHVKTIAEPAQQLTIFV